MGKLIAALTLAFCLGCLPAAAQTAADVDAAIERNLGAPELYRAAFDAIQAAVAGGDGAGFASYVAFPITVTADGEAMVIGDAAQFIEHYDGIVTDEITAAITGQQWEALFVKYQGVMFGNGQVWMNGICKDDACAAFDVKIITIQSTAS